MFYSDCNFLAAKYLPMSRVLNFSKPQGEPKSKSKTPKKSAIHCLCDDHSKIPHKHHTRGPAKSSVMKGFRKVSSDKISSVPISNQGDRAGPSSAKDPTTSSARINQRSSSYESAYGLGNRTKKPPTHEINGSGEPRGKEIPRGSVSLLLGQQATNSAYFTRRYVALPCSQTARIPDRKPSETLHYCEELDPEAFEAYRHFKGTGRLEFSCSEDVGANNIWMACWPIMNAVVLGHILEQPGFADRAMDLLVERLAPGICPDIETIKHMFEDSHTMIPIALRKLVVDRFLDALPHSSGNTDVSKHPSPFQSALLHAALGRLSHRSDPVAVSSCDCHSHGATEACHKQMPEINGTLKGKERAHVCENCAGDSRAAALEENGIKTIDWAYRATPSPEPVRTPILLPLSPISGFQAVSGVPVVVPSVQVNGEQPRSQADESSKKPPDRGSLASAAAELESVNRAGTPFATNLASRYKRSFGPTFSSRGQAKADSVGHNGAYCDVTTSGKPTGNDLSSRKQVGDNFKVYMKCPGAYPESVSSGSGVEVL
jgi:hypothetical protein